MTNTGAGSATQGGVSGATRAVPNAARPAGDDWSWKKRTFAYEETVRVLTRQAAVLSELRNRANIVLAADAVVATLFGASALGKSHPLALKILALVAFGLGIAACVAVLWPVRDTDNACHARQWRVSFHLDEVMHFVEGTDDASWQEGISLFQTARQLNWNTNKWRNRFLQWAAVLLAVQIGLWAAVVLA
jgi:hypothetical protein